MRVHYGIADDKFIRGDVPMTKREIRQAIMNEAKIETDSIIADIGSGTGSIAIEAALGAENGRVYAIERNPIGIELIKKNANKFNVSDRVSIVHALAPEGLNNLPQLDIAFIGGSGGKLNQIIQEITAKLKHDGKIIITAVTMETGYQALTILKEQGLEYYGYQMQINRFRKAGPYHLLKPESPIFIIVATKK